MHLNEDNRTQKTTTTTCIIQPIIHYYCKAIKSSTLQNTAQIVQGECFYNENNENWQNYFLHNPSIWKAVAFILNFFDVYKM